MYLNSYRSTLLLWLVLFNGLLLYYTLVTRPFTLSILLLFWWFITPFLHLVKTLDEITLSTDGCLLITLLLFLDKWLWSPYIRADSSSPIHSLLRCILNGTLSTTILVLLCLIIDAWVMVLRWFITEPSLKFITSLIEFADSNKHINYKNIIKKHIFLYII